MSLDSTQSHNASSIQDSFYFRDMFGTAAMRTLFSDDSRVNAWLEVEVALAKAQVAKGIIPPGTDQKIADAAKLENLDFAAMKADFDKVGFPILPFVKQLTRACDAETARWVHYGATTQDILDTGMVLQMKEGLKLIEGELLDITRSLHKLAEEHMYTVMAGRTFQQLAAPISFGLKAATWLDEIQRHRERISGLKDRLLVGQCSGAVGTFATLQDRGMEVQREMMDILGLGTPDISWHTTRDRWAELLAWIAMVGASCARIAQEVAILMRSEIGELSEPFETGRGASTTLPQKRNPIVCQPIIAASVKLRELVSSQLAAMVQEHERGVGHMHIEWMIMPEAFVLLSGSLSNTANILQNLGVDKEAMKSNLQLGGGSIMSEAAMMGLAKKVGKEKAHHIISAAAARAITQNLTLRESLQSDEVVMEILTESELDALLEPANYLGSSVEMVKMVLSKSGLQSK